MVSETKLVRALKAKEDWAYTYLVKTYTTKLRGLIWNRVSDKSIVADIVQDTFARVFTKIHLFNEECSLEGWLFTVSINVLRDWLKKSVRQTNIWNEEAFQYVVTRLQKREMDIDSPDIILECHEELEQLTSETESLLSTLSKPHLKLLMAAVNGASYDDLAKRYKTKRSTIRMRLFYIREKLRKMVCEFPTISRKLAMQNPQTKSETQLMI